MQAPPEPDNEVARQAALEQTGLLNSGAEERFDRVTRLAQRLFDVPIALLTLVDGQRQWFKSCQGLGVSETPRNVSFCGHAILDEEGLIVEDALSDERFADNPLVTGPPHIRFYAGAPLHGEGGHRIGTLCIIDDTPRCFSEVDRATLRDMAATIESLVLADALQRSSRVGLESALQQSERRARLVIEGTDVGTWQWNVQTGETVFNERWAQMVGYTLQELAPVSIDTWMSLAHPDDLKQSEALLTRHFAGELDAYDCKARMRHKQGHWVWVHDRGRVFEWTPDGAPLLMYGTHADITAEVEAEEALRVSRDKYASLVANLPGVTYRCLQDEQWTMLYISKQVDSVSGYSAAELIDNASISYADLIHPDDAAAVSDAVSKAMADHRGWHMEYRILHKSGEWRWVEERGRAVEGDADHPIVLEGFLVDVTREYRAREQLARHHDALMALNAIAFNSDSGIDARIHFALERARAFLSMDAAVVSRIEGEVYTLQWLSALPDLDLQKGQKLNVGETWCRVWMDTSQSELFLPDARDECNQDYACAPQFAAGAYIGLVIEVDNRVFGTLNFTASAPRNSDFDESEKLFVRLLAQWLVNTLEADLNNNRLEKLMAELPGMVYQFRRFPDGRSVFPFSSPGIFSFYGITPEEAAEDAGPAFECIHPEDLPAVTESIERSAQTLETWRSTYRLGPANQGECRWVTGQARPERLADGSVLWHGYIDDIHDQEMARQALERSESRLRSLFEFSPIGIALNDLETGQFIDLNPALLAPTGYSREEFVKLSYWDITPREYEPLEAKALEDLKSRGGFGPFDKEYIRKDGSRYPVRLQGVVSHDADGRAMIWSLIEDISEQRRLERMKDQFISTVSHELRTPLTSITGALGLLAAGVAGALPEKVQKLVSTADRNAQRLASLINDLLDMEKLVAGKMPIKTEVQPVLPVILEAVDSMEEYARQYRVGLHIANPLPDKRASIDADRLLQAMTNLISNGIKFSPENGDVTVGMALDGDRLLVTIRDQGPGVEPEFRDRLFERFARSDNSDTRKVPGTGLGLAITRELVRRMDGDVFYQDAPGGGSLFSIALMLK